MGLRIIFLYHIYVAIYNVQLTIFEVLKQNTSNHDIYGACAPILNESTHFEYGIGMEFSDDNIPDGYTIWEVKPTLWAVFKCIGENGDCIGETWGKIFSEFLPSSEYSMIDDTDFELYSQEYNADCFCGIFVVAMTHLF